MHTDNLRPAVLIVQDDPRAREQIKWALWAEYSVLEAADRRTALRIVYEVAPQVVLLDAGLPSNPYAPPDELVMLRELFRLKPDTKIILITGRSDRISPRSAIDGGAYDVIEKPIDSQRLNYVVRRAAYVHSLEQENERLTEPTMPGGLSGMLSVSPVMHKVFEAICRAVHSNLPVLITGERGTGKDLAARVIHQRGESGSGPFFRVVCGATHEVGHETVPVGRGSAAGLAASVDDIHGMLELAAGGTLVLDNIGEMSLSAQQELSRFLLGGQTRRSTRSDSIPKTRVVVMTRDDPTHAATVGRLRKDLFGLLSSTQVSLPPLRERREDLPLLARSFLSRYRRQFRRNVMRLSPAATDALMAYSWPGNVRELENRIRRAILLCEGPAIRAADLDLPGHTIGKPVQRLKEAKAQLEKELIQGALVIHNGNITQAAKDLGISRQALHECINRYSLGKEQ